MSEENKRLECKITGRVQMVMFRDFTNKTARKLGLTGMVRNMPDGSVYIIAEGEEEKLRELVEKLKSGPLFARVDHVEEKFLPATGEFKNFMIDFYGNKI
ncbi:acylphosphatase [Patescibacteria group bacterium]